MKLLVSWLRDFVDLRVEPHALATTLSRCGFEVASIDPPPAGLVSPAGLPTPGTDAVIDFEITANRPDCLSVIGLVREAAAAFDLPLRLPAPVNDGTEVPPLAAGQREVTVPGLSVVIAAPDLCPRYAAAVVDVHPGPSPRWLAGRLEAAGVRPINNVVDVTNYVLLETGHPLHAFDLDRLDGASLRIRRAASGERITTLDGEDRPLEPEMLVIADASRPQAVAGVMGGARSEVSAATRTVVLESAWFLPSSVRRTSKRLGLKTEASTRFERGADVEAPLQALRRAVDVLSQIGAGVQRGPLVDCRAAPHASPVIGLRRARLARVLGLVVDDQVVVRVLTALGFALTDTDDGWRVAVPSWRIDVSREIDLIEEVARHHGYDQVPTTFPALDRLPAAGDPRIERARLVRHALVACGFVEAITFSFIERPAAERFADGETIVDIAYPLSETFASLRPSLLPGLIEALARNRRRQSVDVRLFEVGACFGADRGEHRRVAFAWTGTASPEHWSGSTRPVDFFDARGVVECLTETFRAVPGFVAATRPYLLPGRTAEVRCGGQIVGVVGQLLPAVADVHGLPAATEVYLGEIDLDRLADAGDAGDVRFRPLPRFPSVVRDLSVVVPAGLPAEALRATIRAAAPDTLVRVVEFDRYVGTGIADGHVSLSHRLTFQSAERTMTDGEADAAMEAVVLALGRAHGAVRR